LGQIPNSPNSDVESGHQITFIAAKIVTVDKQADKTSRHRANGSCQEGRLDLIYYRDPGLKEEGQTFPLWTIQ
jgi:hypothetical protein